MALALASGAARFGGRTSGSGAWTAIADAGAAVTLEGAGATWVLGFRVALDFVVDAASAISEATSVFL